MKKDIEQIVEFYFVFISLAGIVLGGLHLGTGILNVNANTVLISIIAIIVSDNYLKSNFLKVDEK